MIGPLHIYTAPSDTHGLFDISAERVFCHVTGSPFILFDVSRQIKVGEIFSILFADFQKPAGVLVGAVVLRQLISNIQCAQGKGRQGLPGTVHHGGGDGVHLPHGGGGGMVDQLALVQDAVEHAPVMEAVLQEVQPAFKKEARSDIPVKVWDLKDANGRKRFQIYTNEEKMAETVTVSRHRC